MTEQAKWELINPMAEIKSETVSASPHPGQLEGKTVLLRWNGKHSTWCSWTWKCRK